MTARPLSEEEMERLRAFMAEDPEHGGIWRIELLGLLATLDAARARVADLELAVLSYRAHAGDTPRFAGIPWNEWLPVLDHLAMTYGKLTPDEMFAAICNNQKSPK